MFSKVVYKNLNENIIAQVNRNTRELYLNKNVFKYLNKDEKNFVLFHEAGHLYLDTADEFLSTDFAKNEFLKVAEINSENDLNQKIVILTDLTRPQDLQNKIFSVSKIENNKNNFVSALVGGLLTVGATILSKVNIGSKARLRELQEQARIQEELNKKQQQQQRITLIVVSAIVIIAVFVFLYIKKTKKL